jgi:hypothetical protein
VGHRLPIPVLKHKVQCAVRKAVVVCFKIEAGVATCFVAVTPGVSVVEARAWQQARSPEYRRERFIAETPIHTKWKVFCHNEIFPVVFSIDISRS